MRQEPTQTANVVLGITDATGKHCAKHWTGRSKASILAAARKRYPGAKIRAGAVWYTNSYGAH